MADGIFGNAGGFFTPERSAGFQAIGQALSQLGAGQQVNLSQPLAALQKRQQDAKTREQLEGLSGRFTPDQQAILATMSPSQAAQIIAQDAFRAPAAPTKGIVINGQLVNPVTGQPMGDFRTPEARPDTGFIVSGQQALADYGLDPEFSYNITTGPSGVKASRIGGGGVEVNLPGQPQIGTIPTGQQLIEDPTTGAFRLENIPGGALEQAEAAAAAKAETGAGLGEIKRSVVDDQIDTALELMEQKGVLDFPEAGIIGSALGSMGINQEAVDLKNTLAGIQATVAFDTLQKMREASKSGGALGSVSERELDLLISAYGALQQSTSAPLLRKNLNTVKRIMGKIANDPVASQFISRDNQPAGGAGGFVIRGRVD